jgi:hypothetical protein
MTDRARILVAAGLLIVLAGCQGRTDRTDSGGVLLSASFNNPPSQFVTSTEKVLPVVPTTTIQNVVVDPAGVSSTLENVELRSYQIIYTRADTGTRLPPPLVEPLSGVVPVNGSLTITGLNLMTNAQFGNPPISDIDRFGVDRETGSIVVELNLTVTFFGRTLSGKEVASAPTGFRLEIIQAVRQ